MRNCFPTLLSSSTCAATARPRFNCVKKLNAAGQCRATSAQRTSISRLFQFAAYQIKVGTDGLFPPSVLI